MSRPIVLLFVCAGLAAAQPTIQVRNAAAFSVTLTPDLAPGSIIELTITSSIDLERPYSISVEDAVGTSRPAKMIPERWFSSNSQFKAILPVDLRIGDGRVTLHYNDTQASTPIRVVPISFALYARPAYSRIANAQNISPEGNTQQNGLTTPARPGDYLTFWGTGLGTEVPRPLYVVIGGREAKMIWAGKAPEDPGVDQINVYLDSATLWTEGCYIPVRVRTAGIDAPLATISIAKEGVCKHPLNLSLEEMKTLDRGEAISFATVNANRVLGPQIVRSAFAGFLMPTNFTWNETANANFNTADAAVIAANSGSMLIPGTCTSGSNAPNFIWASLQRSGGVGEKVTLQGPGGRLDMTSPFPESGIYRGTIPSPPPQVDPSLLSPSFFRAGNWTLSAPGSVQVLPFQLPLTISPPMIPANLSELQMIDYTAAYAVRWNPAGYREGDLVTVTVSAQVGHLSCTALAQAGEFLISVADLAQLKPSRYASPFVSLELIPKPQLFSVPLVDGGTMRGVFRDGASFVTPVTGR